MDYQAKTWYNDGKDSDGNVVADAPKLDADNLNRLESGIKNVHDRVDKIYSENLVRACDYSRTIKWLYLPKGESDIIEQQWTATEDCWLSIESKYGSENEVVGKLDIDSNRVLTITAVYDSNGYNSRYYLPPCIFVKKGSVITLHRDMKGSAYADRLPLYSAYVHVNAYACLG